MKNIRGRWRDMAQSLTVLPRNNRHLMTAGEETGWSVVCEIMLKTRTKVRQTIPSVVLTPPRNHSGNSGGRHGTLSLNLCNIPSCFTIIISQTHDQLVSICSQYMRQPVCIFSDFYFAISDIRNKFKWKISLRGKKTLQPCQHGKMLKLFSKCYIRDHWVPWHQKLPVKQR